MESWIYVMFLIILELKANLLEQGQIFLGCTTFTFLCHSFQIKQGKIFPMQFDHAFLILFRLS